MTLGNTGAILNGSIATTSVTVPPSVLFTFDGVNPLSTDVTVSNAGVLNVVNDLTLDNATITLASSNSN